MSGSNTTPDLAQPAAQEATDVSAAQSPSSNLPPQTSSQETASQNLSAGADAPRKKRSFLNIPSRTSSSKQDLPSTTTPTTGAATADAEGSAVQGSKKSLLNRPRNGSKASSRQSLRLQKKTEDTAQPATAIPQSDGTARSEKKGKSGFLSFLNCCGGSDGGNAADMEEPPKKATKLQPPVRRSSRTAEKTATSNASPNDAEAKEAPLDEKTDLNEGPNNAAISSKKRIQEDARPRITRDESSREKVTSLPAVVPIPFPSTPSATTPYQQPNETSPSPSQPPATSQDASTHDQVTSFNPQNQTSVLPANDTARQQWPVEGEQPNADVEMTDAAPALPEEEHEEVAEPAQPDLPVPIAQNELPPPPPLSKRESQLASKEAPPVPAGSSEKQTWLLPPVQPHLRGRKCLVLDLDETLVHSSFKILHQADFTIPVEIEGQYHNVYVIKRPGVDAFMKRVGELYEVVVFTASVSKYGDPLLDQLDIHHVVHHRLFRESCYNHQGNYVKVAGIHLGVRNPS